MDSRQNIPRPIRDDRGNFLPKITSKHGEEIGFSRKKCAWETACLQKGGLPEFDFSCNFNFSRNQAGSPEFIM